MITIRHNKAWGLRSANRILLLCIIHGSCVVVAQPRLADGFGHSTTKAGVYGDREVGDASPLGAFQKFDAQAGQARSIDLGFAHLTTHDGLSQSSITEILQDRRGFMWFATRDGLNRYDGNTFVVHKHNPNDPGSLGSNFIKDLVENDHG